MVSESVTIPASSASPPSSSLSPSPRLPSPSRDRWVPRGSPPVELGLVASDGSSSQSKYMSVICPNDATVRTTAILALVFRSLGTHVDIKRDLWSRDGKGKKREAKRTRFDQRWVTRSGGLIDWIIV